MTIRHDVNAEGTTLSNGEKIDPINHVHIPNTLTHSEAVMELARQLVSMMEQRDNASQSYRRVCEINSELNNTNAQLIHEKRRAVNKATELVREIRSARLDNATLRRLLANKADGTLLSLTDMRMINNRIRAGKSNIESLERLISRASSRGQAVQAPVVATTNAVAIDDEDEDFEDGF